jgi:hypothetical protein
MASDFSLQTSAARKAATTLVVAETRSFAAFDQWMDLQLDLLVARWIHTAAPNAERLAMRADCHRRNLK